MLRQPGFEHEYETGDIVVAPKWSRLPLLISEVRFYQRGYPVYSGVTAAGVHHRFIQELDISGLARRDLTIDTPIPGLDSIGLPSL